MEIKITDLTKNNPTTTQLGLILGDIIMSILEEVENGMIVENLETNDVTKTIRIVISKKEEES